METLTRRRTQDGNGDENENSSGDGNECGDGNGNEDRIGEGGREATKRKKPHNNNSCRCHVENGGDLPLGGKRKKRRKERVGSVIIAPSPDNLENRVTRKQGGSTRYPGLINK